MIIAINTSTETASIAIADGGRIAAEQAWRIGQNHTTQLLPNIENLLKHTRLEIETATCIVVAIGPGSYNGLRVGVAAAKGLAFALGIPMIGVGTLDVEAYQHADKDLPVCPVFNASRDEVATAVFRKTDGEWRQTVEGHLSTIEALCEATKEKTLFCGEYLPSVSGEIKELLGEKAIFAGMGANVRRAAFMIELVMKRIDAGDFDDPVTLQPVYFRGPAITVAKHAK